MLICYCCYLHQELVDGGLLNQLSPRTCDLVPVLTQLLIPPTEIDGAVLKQKCAQINKALEVLSDILVNLNRCTLYNYIQFVYLVRSCNLHAKPVFFHSVMS